MARLALIAALLLSVAAAAVVAADLQDDSVKEPIELDVLGDGKALDNSGESSEEDSEQGDLGTMDPLIPSTPDKEDRVWGEEYAPGKTCHSRTFKQCFDTCAEVPEKSWLNEFVETINTARDCGTTTVGECCDKIRAMSYLFFPEHEKYFARSAAPSTEIAEREVAVFKDIWEQVYRFAEADTRRALGIMTGPDALITLLNRPASEVKSDSDLKYETCGVIGGQIDQSSCRGDSDSLPVPTRKCDDNCVHAVAARIGLRSAAAVKGWLARGYNSALKEGKLYDYIGMLDTLAIMYGPRVFLSKRFEKAKTIQGLIEVKAELDGEIRRVVDVSSLKGTAAVEQLTVHCKDRNYKEFMPYFCTRYNEGFFSDQQMMTAAATTRCQLDSFFAYALSHFSNKDLSRLRRDCSASPVLRGADSPAGEDGCVKGGLHYPVSLATHIGGSAITLEQCRTVLAETLPLKYGPPTVDAVNQG